MAQQPVAGRVFALAERPLPAHRFSLTEQQLAELAASDDGFASAMDLVANSSSETGIFYVLRPDFTWGGDYAAARDGFQGAFGFRGYSLQLTTNSTDVTLPQICGDGVPRVPVELFPPPGRVVAGRGSPEVPDDNTPTAVPLYGDTKPIANDNAVCVVTEGGAVEAWDDDFFAALRDGSISHTFGYKGLHVKSALPLGSWAYEVAGEAKAAFDVGVTVPLTADRTVNGPAPVVRVNTGGMGEITSVEVAWLLYDPAASCGQPYCDVVDPAVLETLIDEALVYFDNVSTGPRRFDFVGFDPATQPSIVPPRSWYWGYNGPASEQAEVIGVFYSSAGRGHFFTFQRYVYPAAHQGLWLPVPLEYTDYGTPPPPPPDGCNNPTDPVLVTYGQQFLLPQHDGLDFGFDRPPADAVYRRILAPCDGVVTQVVMNDLMKGFDLGIQCDATRSALLALKPCSDDPAVYPGSSLDEPGAQEREIRVFPGDAVRRGDVVARVVVPWQATKPTWCPAPHVHWGVFDNAAAVCPRDGIVDQTQRDQLDDLYAHLCAPTGWLTPVCP
ncbi:MAG: hypothetical protein HY906_09140 [Deltaproteobacteria bacterium]|nr:hypothetical protein [Deltaproteobacteria bacterium]